MDSTADRLGWRVHGWEYPVVCRRTVCVYCGERIAGTLWSSRYQRWNVPEGVPRSGPEFTAAMRRMRYAARFACSRHLDLPALDDFYRS